MSITKIVVTGGPCGGKSTAMSRIESVFSDMGYRVLFVPETATELITGGVSPRSCGTNRDFQLAELRLQLEKERIFKAAAETMAEEKILIVCDRGAIDNKAYMSEEDFLSVLSELGESEVGLRDGYDAVFHLVTAAKGAVEFYTTRNNSARTETPEEAARLDDLLINAWTGHPHLRVIDNATDFEDKMRRLVAEIAAFLGEPEPFEIERKFLIEYPDTDWLASQPSCKRVEIIQTYLRCAEGDEVRVRQRGDGKDFVYFLTTKRRISDLRRVEIERRLSRDEYLRLLLDADTERRQIRKSRYCFTYDSQYLEIDVYPFWNDKAILEVELRDEGEEIKIPPELRVIKEVTEDEEYKNASLARRK